MSSLLSIGTQALTANQSALSYTGQNIANVNTEGYSRQRVNFETQDPPILGVAIQGLQRITDEYLVKQVWKDTSALSSSEQQAQKIELLDKLMVSDSTSLTSSFDKFFTALQRSVDDPLFIANRQLFLAEAQSLTDNFRNFDSRLREQLGGLTTEIRSMSTDINSLTASIASLNTKIASLAAGRQNYNTLIDERDQLIKQLSSYLSIDTISPDGGITTNLNLANGEPLVVAGRASQLSVREGRFDPSQTEVYLTRGALEVDITPHLGEGALGGIATYRDQVLMPTLAEVGRIALAFTSTMNAQHRQGMDLYGDLGGDLFNATRTGEVFVSSENKRPVNSASLFITDTGALQASNYSFRMTGLESFEVIRQSDGKVFSSDSLPPEDIQIIEGVAGKKLSVEVEGFRFELSAASLPAIGDEFLFKPTSTGARNMSVAISNPKLLALASPIRVVPAETNEGNAFVADIQVTDSRDTSPLRAGAIDPLELRFNADGTYSVFDVSDPASPVVFSLAGYDYSSMTYSAGQAITFGSFSVTLQNEPKAGDVFSINYNDKGYSDNRNAIKLAALQSAETIDGFSYQDIYGQLLAQVGTQANSARIAYMADQSVLSASENALQSVAGVNLDEEATRLIQYQQAYTASTRLITTYQTIFDSLLSAVR